MRFSIIFISLVSFATGTFALQAGDIPLDVAVRGVGNGQVEHFVKKDADAFYSSQKATKRQDPQADLYPVSNDGTGVKAFNGISDYARPTGAAARKRSWRARIAKESQLAQDFERAKAVTDGVVRFWSEAAKEWGEIEKQ